MSDYIDNYEPADDLVSDPGVLPDPEFDLTPSDLVEPTDTILEDPLHGNPVTDAAYWIEQVDSGYCAPAAVAQVVNQLTGAHLDDVQLTAMAEQMGLIQFGDDGLPTGMDAYAVEALLDTLGVNSDVEVGSVDDLIGRLDAGQQIIVGVDSGAMWGTGESGVADHAVEITGIDTETGVVYLNDSGRPDGAAVPIPLEVFEDAWSNGGHQMIVTDEAVAPAAVVEAPTADEPAIDVPVVEPVSVPAADADVVPAFVLIPIKFAEDVFSKL